MPRLNQPRPPVAKTVANPEVERVFATGGKPVAAAVDDDDLLAAVDRGKSDAVTEIGAGWRLETNSDGRWRWRWQIKDDWGNSVTYVNEGGKTVYMRGSRYVGITQRDRAEKHDRERTRGRHKRGGRRAPGR